MTFNQKILFKTKERHEFDECLDTQYYEYEMALFPCKFLKKWYLFYDLVSLRVEELYGGTSVQRAVA